MKFRSERKGKSVLRDSRFSLYHHTSVAYRKFGLETRCWYIAFSSTSSPLATLTRIPSFFISDNRCAFMILAVRLVRGRAKTTPSDFLRSSDSPLGPLKNLTPFTADLFLE